MKRYLGSLAILVALPGIALAQNTGWLNSVAAGFGNIVSAGIRLLIVIAMAVFVWGMVIFIQSAGDDTKREQGKKKMVWGIVALFAIVSIWGLVALLQQIFGVSIVNVLAPRTG